MHILGQKEATWNTIFSIFERRWGPQNVAGPGKTFPSLDGPAGRTGGEAGKAKEKQVRKGEGKGRKEISPHGHF